MGKSCNKKFMIYHQNVFVINISHAKWLLCKYFDSEIDQANQCTIRGIINLKSKLIFWKEELLLG